MTREDAFAIGRLDATGQAALVARGEVAPVDLVEAAIIRIDALDPALNALTFRDDDAARRRAKTAEGPMAGVPWLVKDGFDYPGMPTRSGSRSRRDAPAGTTAFPYTERLDAAGLIAIGKTNAPEFGLLPTTEPLLYGAARNPWALDRSPGGSSGGAAVAVASGMVPIAHAADGGGSIRIPASNCGLVGLKPGRGGNVRARDPHIIEDLLVGDTLLARSVRDVAWATAVTAPLAPVSATPDRRRLRIAVIPESLDRGAPAPEVQEALDFAAALCASIGHDVDLVRSPVDGPAVAAAFRTIWGYLARDSIRDAVSRLGASSAAVLEPWTLDLAAWGSGIEAIDADRLFGRITAAEAALGGFLADYDVILSPVLRLPALPIGALAPDRPFDEIMALMFDYVSYTPLHNLTGLPAISLPLYPGDGVPIGSMFAAARGQEPALLALAYELEAAAPWSGRWPAHSIGATSALTTA